MNTVSTTAPDRTTPDLIAEYEQHLIRRRRAAATIEGYVGILRHMDRELPAGLICATTDELQDWIFVDGRADTTLEHYVVVVQGFGRWASNPREPRLDYDATEDLPRTPAEAEHPTRAATQAEVDDIFDRCKDEACLDLFTLAAFGGLRCVEISRARREHITAEQIMVLGKGGKKAAVPTHPRLWGRLQERPPGPIVLTRDRGPARPLSRNGVTLRGRAGLLKLGYARLSMHSLRKFFGTQVYENAGRDIRVAQDLLRHSHVTTTQKYVEVDKERRINAVLALGLGSQPAA